MSYSQMAKKYHTEEVLVVCAIFPSAPTLRFDCLRIVIYYIVFESRMFWDGNRIVLDNYLMK